ncbi:MAG TPA: nuclear transport factor 2 family protein, partial [Terriglobales bacterium]|nr:nuclear transport factor 2 family protein [Terriglobales bacterium]
LAVLLALVVPCLAAKPSTADQLTALLREFLAGVSKNDNSVYDRFFADDLIYTRSAGVTITKTDIMKSFDEPPPKDARQGTYTAEDVTVRQYGSTAIVAFRLVQKMDDGETNTFRNTGTFIRRNNRWQVVAWQATRIPKVEAFSGRESAAADGSPLPKS